MTPITPPVPQEWRLTARAVTEALAQATPITAGLAGIYRYTHPSQLDRDIEAWRAAVSERVNDHDAAIAALEAALKPKLRITEQALALGVWIARASPNGLGHPGIAIEALSAAFVDMKHEDLLEAVVELEALGMLDVFRAIGGVRQVRPLASLFATFDGAALGYNTIGDAVYLAKLLLAAPELAGRTSKLDAEAKLLRRRFNPALAMLLPMMVPGLISKESQPDFPTSGFRVEETARFRLRQFVADHDEPSAPYDHI